MSHANNPEWPRRGENPFVLDAVTKNKRRRQLEAQQKRSRRNVLKHNRKVTKENGQV